jgi:hypothetical protein
LARANAARPVRAICAGTTTEQARTDKPMETEKPMKTGSLYLSNIIVVIAGSLLAQDFASASTTYEIWRNAANSTSSAQRIALFVNGTSYDDTTAQNGTTYFYWVKARTYYSAWEAHFISYDVRYVTNYLICPISSKRGENSEIFTATDFYGSPGQVTAT